MGPHRFHPATPLLHHRRPTTTTTTSPPSWLSPHRHVTRSRPPRFSQRAAPHSVLVISPTRVAPRSVYPSRPTWATLSLSCVGSAGVGMVEEGAERLNQALQQRPIRPELPPRPPHARPPCRVYPPPRSFTKPTCSRHAPHPSTSYARRCLSAEARVRVPQLTWYGHPWRVRRRAWPAPEWWIAREDRKTSSAFNVPSHQCWTFALPITPCC